jgi:hypothetical protein
MGGMGNMVAGGNTGGGDSSNSTPSSQSSTNSSQDSLHKPPPKKKGGGLKTSIGRIFSSKKEKPSKETPNRGYHTLPASTKSRVFLYFINFLYFVSTAHKCMLLLNVETSDCCLRE